MNDRLKAMWASIKARSGNTGRALNTQYKSNRELSESEYRAKYRQRRGAYLGAAAGAVGAGVVMHRRDQAFRNATHNIKQAGKMVGNSIGFSGVDDIQDTIIKTATKPIVNKSLKYVGKKVLPFAAGGLAAGALFRGFTNKERVEKIKPRNHINEESSRLNRVRRVT